MEMNPPRDDLALLAGWRQGDAEAGNELIRRHVPVLTRFFANKVGARTPDLVQSTLLALIQASDDLTRVRRFRSYLLGIAKNQLLMGWRRRDVKRRAASFLDDVSGPRTPTSPSASVAQGESRTRVLGFLRQLPLEYQVAVELYYWQGLQISEIVQVTGATVGTVKKPPVPGPRTSWRPAAVLIRPTGAGP